jgi:L-rhamnose-H+ transport protein
MNSYGDVLLGAGIVVLAGILQGLFAVPMKFARRWNHENIWLIFALTGLVIFPWLLTSLTVPDFLDVYSATSTRTIVKIAGFGLFWGIGATFTGIGLNMLGIGLGLAIILGLSASVGSLVPLLFLHPEKLGTSEGRLYVGGTAVMLAGIALVSRAGALRDKRPVSSSSPSGKGSFGLGLLVAVASGLFSSALNFSYAFGGEVLTGAARAGVPSVWASNLIAAPATTGGFVANAVYCGYQLFKNSSTAKFGAAGTRRNWLLGTLMGAFWFGGLAIYGLGVARMGDFGTVVGWPLLMGAIILASNAAGFATGEWRAARAVTIRYLFAGMAVILFALWILALAQRT